MALARPLADPGEHRDALVALHHGVDQFHQQHGLADAGAAEHRRLAAECQRHQQVDHLDAGFEHRGRGGLRGERRRRAMDRQPGRIGRQRRSVVVHRAGDIEQSAEHGIADRRGQRAAGRAGTAVPRRRPEVACKAIARTVQASRWLCTSAISRSCLVDVQRFADRRQRAAVERDIQHRATNGAHAARVARARAADTCQAGFHHRVGRLRDGADHVSAADNADQLAVTHDRHAA